MELNIKVFRAVLALTLSAPVLSYADATNNADNYPTNYDNCKYIITQPEGAGTALRSRDCKTIYVLPDTVGVFEARPSLNEGTLSRMCPLLESHQLRYKVTSEQIAQLNLKLMELMATNNPKYDNDIIKLKARIDGLIAETEKLKDPFKNVEGGKAFFTIRAEVSSHTLQKYYQMNMELVRTQGIKFESMPVRDGYLSVTAYDPKESLFPATQGIYVSGLKVSAEGPGQNLYKVKNVGAGQLVLGMTKSCELYKKQQKARSTGRELSPQELGAELIAEVAPAYHFSYPVLSTISYSATLDVDRATRLVLDHVKTKSQFKISEFSTMLGDGQASDIFKMSVDLSGLSNRFANEQEKSAFQGNLVADVRERLAAKFLRELQSVDLVKFEAPSPSEVPNPGNKTEVVGKQRVCDTESFLGVTIRRECYDRVITRTFPVDGVLEETLKKVQNFNIHVAEELKIHDLALDRGTVIF